MPSPNLLTIFIAIVAAAVLVQTGILIGLCVVTSKLNRQTDRAFKEAHRLNGPLERFVEAASTMSTRLTELGAQARASLERFHTQAERMEKGWQETLRRWSKPA